MHTTFKKLGAFILALVMIFALSATAFAADTAGDVYQDDSQTAVSGVNIPLKKSIVFFNANGSDVYEPNITYTYTVAPVTVNAGATVTDDGEYNLPTNDPVTVRVNNGVADGVDGVTLTFSSANAPVAALSTGTEVEKSGNLKVNLDKFLHAGIYRYLVTEAQNPTDVTEKGLEARTGDYNNTRYLDVYIANKADGSGLELKGAVFFKTDAKDASDPVNNATDAITTTTDKTTGFEPGTPDSGSGTIDYTNDKTVDRYTTYDIEVKKSITGSMADKTHEFPFYVKLTNSITGAKYTYVDVAGTSAAEEIADAKIEKGTDAKTSALKLKDSQSVKFIGVPSNQTAATPLNIDVKEFNDSVDYYSASATAKNGTAPTVTMDGDTTHTSMTAESGYAVLSTFDVKTNDVAAQVITVINNLAEISPTGVVLRVAPYALMLGAGFLFILLAKRRKEEPEEA